MGEALFHCSLCPLWGNAPSSDSVLNMGISLDCFLGKWQRKMVAIIGFKVLDGESCHFINSSPYTLFPCCEII